MASSVLYFTLVYTSLVVDKVMYATAHYSIGLMHVVDVTKLATTRVVIHTLSSRT